MYEIKNNLLFNISHLEQNHNLDDFIKFNKINFENSIVLSLIKNREFLIDSQKIDKKKILFILKTDHAEEMKINYIDFPINIYELVEKINIQLIKQKYNFQSKIKVVDYFLDINSRKISKGNISLKLTEKEINLILFLNKKKSSQKVNILQDQVWGYSSKLETHTVETHIYRLRKKIDNKFNDIEFIISNEDGYLIK